MFVGWYLEWEYSLYMCTQYIAQHYMYGHTNFRKYTLCKIGYSQLLHVYILAGSVSQK